MPHLVKADRARAYGADLSSSGSGGSGAALWSGGAPAAGSHWARGGSGGSPGRGSSFNLTATVRFPKQPIAYVPGASEVLLQAWVPYLAVLVLIWWLLDRGLLGFVFEHRLVDCLARPDAPLVAPDAATPWGQPRLKAH